MPYPDYEEIMRYNDEAAQPDTTKAELFSDLRAMGVEGRHVMVHASYKILAPVQGGPAGVVDAFVDAVGDGVVLFPTFDFESWTERGYWDCEKTPSRMGVITEKARRPGDFFRRTHHPMLSFAVSVVRPEPWLDYQDGKGYFADVPNAHGAGSVFAKLIENDGLLLSIGADKQAGFKAEDVGFTASVHAFVEAGVDWRVMKLFRGVYVDGGRASIREYAASVTKDPSRHQTAVTPGHLEAERLGIIKRVKLGRTVAWVASAREFHAFAVKSCVERPEFWRKEL